jgi:hypothetical protein
MASTYEEMPMVRTESQPGESRVGMREATLEPPTEASRGRRPKTPFAVVGVLMALLVVGGVMLAQVVERSAEAPDPPAQVEGVTGEEMTDTELSHRLQLDAARQAKLATASRMTDAEQSMRQHLDAARKARLATASRMTDAEQSMRRQAADAREAASR